MNKSKKRSSSRERHMRSRKMNYMVRLLIAVVALIECLVLLTFTTYSWIESSSSLIISTGKDGLGKRVAGSKETISLSVANLMNYQVEVSADAAGNVSLTATDGKYNTRANDGGYYRSVNRFNYSRISSADGKTFYFPKLAKTHDSETGYDYFSGSVSGYRLGDTADYNTSYTYVDFVLKNTTMQTKNFYFDPSITNVFEFKGTDTTVAGQSASSIICNAMRISVQKNNKNFAGGLNDSGSPATGTADSADIYSLTGADYDAVNAVDGTTTNITPRKINATISPDGYTYKYDNDDKHTRPVFTSVADGVAEVEDEISIRIWFEKNDPVYSSLDTEGKATIDGLLAQSDSIKINIGFVNDNVDYDQIFFDDYAFSSLYSARGKFVTDESSNYSMYFHAYNAKVGDYVDYAMSRVAKSASGYNGDAIRWTTAVPMPHVVRNEDNNTDYLTADTTYYQNAYFFYGTIENNAPVPIYKWSLPAVLATQQFNNKWKITEATKYFRSLGVVRGTSNASGYSQIPGFIQQTSASSSGGDMKLVYLKDNATAFTSDGFNEDTTTKNFRYVSEMAKTRFDVNASSSGGGGSGSGESGSGSGSGTINPSYDSIVPNKSETSKDAPNDWWDRIFYVDAPANTLLQFSSTNQPNANQRTDSNGVPAVDGRCYFIKNFQYDNNLVTEQTLVYGEEYTYQGDQGRSYTTDFLTSLPGLNSSDGWVRTYFLFIDNNNTFGYLRNGDAYLFKAWGTAGSGSLEGKYMTSIRNATGYTPSGSTPDPTPTPDPEPSGETVERYKGAVYLNLSTSETSAQSTVGMYYSEDDELFMAYVPQGWLTDDGFVAHYNELNNYYDVTQDKIQWSTGAAGNSTTYTLLGYNDAKQVSDTGIGTGVGTWSDTRQIRFSTELIDTAITSSSRYKISLDSNNTASYPMIPCDDLDYTFMAYLPVDAVGSFSYLRTAGYSSSTVNGTWTPTEAVTATEMTYYPVVTNGTGTGVQGWFHVAVLVDGTYDNLMYKTLCGDTTTSPATPPVQGSSLAYSYDNSTYTNIEYWNDNTQTEVTPHRIDNQRWVVPTKAGNTLYDRIYFRWIPYPTDQSAGRTEDTTFFYQGNVTDDLKYIVVTENR